MPSVIRSLGCFDRAQLCLQLPATWPTQADDDSPPVAASDSGTAAAQPQQPPQQQQQQQEDNELRVGWSPEALAELAGGLVDEQAGTLLVRATAACAYAHAHTNGDRNMHPRVAFEPRPTARWLSFVPRATQPSTTRNCYNLFSRPFLPPLHCTPPVARTHHSFTLTTFLRSSHPSIPQASTIGLLAGRLQGHLVKLALAPSALAAAGSVARTLPEDGTNYGCRSHMRPWFPLLPSSLLSRFFPSCPFPDSSYPSSSPAQPNVRPGLARARAPRRPGPRPLCPLRGPVSPLPHCPPRRRDGRPRGHSHRPRGPGRRRVGRVRRLAQCPRHETSVACHAGPGTPYVRACSLAFLAFTAISAVGIAPNSLEGSRTGAGRSGRVGGEEN